MAERLSLAEESGVFIDLNAHLEMSVPVMVDLRQTNDGWIKSEDLVSTKGRANAEVTIKNMLSAKARGWPMYKAREFMGQTVCLVGGGPSLGKFENLRALRKMAKAGAKIIAVNRTHDFLLSKGIVPWAGMLLDPIANVADYIKPRKGVRYYIGSQCHPLTFDVFDKPDIQKFIYHALAHDEQFEHLTDDERGHMLPKYGNTVLLRAMWLALALGFRELHLWGVDSCYEGEDSLSLHAYHKPETIHDKKRCKIPFPDGTEKIYYSNGAMIAQAQVYEQMIRMMNDMVLKRDLPEFKLRVHGDGIIPDMSSCYGIHADEKRNYQYGRL